MVRALVAYANGTEDLEVTGVASVLDRGGVQVTRAAITNDGSTTVTLAHGTVVTCDGHISAYGAESFDIVVVPGGMPGSTNCAESTDLVAILKKHQAEGRYIAAICAAPGFVLAKHGLITTGPATGYPGCCDNIQNYTGAGTTIDQEHKIVTSKGPAFAIDFGLACLSVLVDANTLAQVKSGMLYE